MAYLFVGLVVAAVGLGASGIEGRIIEDHSNSPLASVNVRISKIGVRELAADLETDREGHFEAPGLPAGDYRIEALKANFIPSSVQLHLTRDGSINVIRLVRCGVISGSVTSQGGGPVRGAMVFALPKPDGNAPLRPFAGSRLRSSDIDGNGRYRIFNLPPGQYAVVACYGAFTMMVGMMGSASIPPGAGTGFQFYPQTAHPQFFVISGGEDVRNIDFSISALALYSVSGKVGRLAQNGSYWLALTGVDQPAIAVAVIQADADGTFRFEGIQPGSYYLFASGPILSRNGDGGFLEPEAFFGRTRVDVAAENVSGVSLRPEAGRSASFVVRSKGRCSGSPQIALTTLEDWGTVLNKAVTAPFGEVKAIENLAPARYRVTVNSTADCYGSEVALDLSGSGSQAPLDLTLSPAGSIRGKLDAETQHASDFVVVLVSSDSVQFAQLDATGAFDFRGLRPGKYRIAAQPAVGRSRWVADLANMLEFDVGGGAALQIDLAAPVVNK